MCLWCEIPLAEKKAFWQEHSRESFQFKDVTRLKINLLGDADCETMSLLGAFNAKRYPYHEREPYLQFKLLMFQGNPCELLFTNISGEENYMLRIAMYLGADVTLLCYSVDCQKSFANISNKWFPEVKSHCPKTPVILVGLRRNDETEQSSHKLHENRPVVTVNSGKKLRGAIGASDFMECSALKGEGVEDVLESAIKAALKNRKKEQLRRRLRGFVSCCTFP